MGTKTISIMDDAYTLLASHKKNDESFSDTIRRVLTKRHDIMKFAGAFGHLSEDKKRRVRENVINIRKKMNDEMLERIKELK